MYSFHNRLIINADDLGFSSQVNTAIFHCLDQGIINSASLMTNTPGFTEAVNIIHEKGYAHCVGIHVNFTAGKPLSGFSDTRYLNRDGTWNKDVMMTIKARFGKKLRDEFAAEIVAQIQAMEKAGIRPSHVNAHHHVHTLPAFFYLFLNICRAYGYKMRIAQTHFSGSYVKLAYRRYINAVIRKYNLHFSDYFETLASFELRKRLMKKGMVEIMVHPSMDEKDILLDASEDNHLKISLKNLPIEIERNLTLIKPATVAGGKSGMVHDG